ncbi:MAG: quinone oxidoreductase [Gemmatimonadota bacterium]
MKAIRIHRTGGPEVLSYEDVELGPPGPGEVRIRHTAIGLNFIDTYHREGLYPVPLPTVLGMEAAGVVEALGAGVTTLAVGDRVAYGNGPIGAYSEARNAPAGRLVRLPDSIGDETAAAVMLKGMTVRYLLKETFAVRPGQTILFHAAAGGVGLIAGQWAAALGATAIGTAGSDEKCTLAIEHGYAHCINYNTEDVAERVREITGGEKVPVVYDGVGRSTFEASLDCLQRRGLLVSFGNASGPVTGVDLGILARKGSLYVTRPGLAAYVTTDEELQANAADVIDVVARGAVRLEIAQRFPLAKAADAHRALEARQTTGSTVLIP